MKLSNIIKIIFISINYVLSKKTNDVEFTLDDFTVQNTIIGNLFKSINNEKPKIPFSDAVLRNSKDLFKINTNGDIITLVNIDRDDICIKLLCCKDLICSMNITAILLMTTPVSYNVFIKIIDFNDNKPVFSNPFTLINIPESDMINSTYKLPTAIDKDSFEYGIDRYSLLDQTNTFKQIMKQNGPYLKLMKSLNRETIEKYNITLFVYGKGKPLYNNSLNLIVKISDVNDNKPYFVKLDSNNKYIPINSSGSYIIEIKENQTSSQEIYTFHALDSDEGDNSKITYSISSSLSSPPDVVQKKFSLESPYETAKIRLRLNLDYENESERLICLVIIATDNGKPAQSASISLTIKLIDINDNLPEITESAVINISENNGNVTKLKFIHIKDNDLISKEKINCFLNEESNRKFKLERYSDFWDFYRLENRVAFDYEKRKFETVRIVCIDKAEPELTQTTELVVNIVDENDNSPKWVTKEYYVKINENADPNNLIITVNATDADSKKFGKLYYNITEESIPNTLNFVRINHVTGAIQMTKSIDREEYPNLIYFVTVTDNFESNKNPSSKIIKNSNKTKLTIEILDVNDNPPIFKGGGTYFQISESSEINTIIGRLIFTDNDEPPFNIVNVTIIDDDTQFSKTNWFGIAYNNSIVVRNKLDREYKNNFSIIVQAVDHGNPPKSTTVKIEIDILDVNDNYPKLTTPFNGSFIPNNGFISTNEKNKKITQIFAEDKDLGLNGTLNYRLTYTNLANRNYIKINEVSGEIFTNWDNFDSGDVGIYVIQITISDKGNPPLSINVLFHVNITSPSNPTTDAYMSNIVILILIIVCSLALIVSLIAAIFWVRFRVSNDSPVNCHEEFYEREHLNKEINANQYSLINLDKTFRQNSYENNRLNSYEAFQGFHHDSYVQNRNHTNYSNNTLHDTIDKSRMTPCEDCLTVYGTVPTQFNRFDTNLSRLRHPIIPDLNTTFNGNLITANPKSFILQSYCDNDYKTVSNIQPATLIVEPNFSDSGKGGSVEDLNYRQFTGISTFTSSSFVNTSSANAKLFCQNPNLDSKLNQCLYDKSSETMF